MALGGQRLGLLDKFVEGVAGDRQTAESNNARTLCHGTLGDSDAGQFEVDLPVRCTLLRFSDLVDRRLQGIPVVKAESFSGKAPAGNTISAIA